MAVKYQVPVRELGGAETFSFADPASATGLAVFRLERRLSPSRRTLTERLTGRLYTMSAVTQVVHPLTELRAAREVVAALGHGFSHPLLDQLRDVVKRIHHDVGVPYP